MSEDDVEVFWRGMNAFNAGDLGGFLSAFDDDIEFVPLRSVIEGPYHGHAGIRKWWADTAESWQMFNVEVETVHDLGEGKLVAVGVIHAQGKGGGVRLDIPTSWLMELRNGRGLKAEFFFDQHGAFEAAGVSGGILRDRLVRHPGGWQRSTASTASGRSTA
jgi:ketosteroid isomerase-like protein